MAHVTFIHGIGNKPPSDALLSAWLTSLADNHGLELEAEGVTSSMAYWADVLYPEPLPRASRRPRGSRRPLTGSDDVDTRWIDDLAAKVATARAAESVEPVSPVGPAERAGYEKTLPPSMAERLLRTLLRDVHHYLSNVRYSPRPGVQHLIRDVIRERVVETLQKGAARPGPHVVVSHSTGTVIAFDCLKRVQATPKVDAFVTIGSPLGLSEIQDQLKPEWTRSNGFPSERLEGRWLNVYDPRDIVVAAADPKLANDYRREDASVVIDLREDHYGRWRHDIGKYLAGPKLRRELAGLLGLRWP